MGQSIGFGVLRSWTVRYGVIEPGEEESPASLTGV